MRDESRGSDKEPGEPERDEADERDAEELSVRRPRSTHAGRFLSNSMHSLSDSARPAGFWRARVIVLGLLLLGAALRLIAPGQIPPGLYHDEAQHGLDALAALDGHPQLYFAANNGREPMFIYLVTLAVAALGRSPLAVRLPSFFVGFLTLAATYDLGRTLWGRKAGRLALGVLAVTLWHVHLSRVGFRAVLLPLFTALFLSQAVKAIGATLARPRHDHPCEGIPSRLGPSLRQGLAGHWIAAGVLYGASWYTYNAARFTPVAIACVALYGLVFHRAAMKRLWRGALVAAVAALVTLSPLGVYTLEHPEVVLARTGQVSIFSEQINGGHFWQTLGRHVLATLGMFSIRGDRIWRHNVAWRPVWGPALGLAFTIGLGVVLAQFRRRAGMAAMLLWTAAMAVPTLLAEDAPHFLRGVGVLPTAVLLPVLGLAWLSRVPLQRGLAGLIPALLLAGGFGSTVYDYFVRYPSEPLVYHWFEAGPVALAGEINTFLGSGWDGSRMLRGAPPPLPSPNGGGEKQVYIDPQIWGEWTSLSFLIPPSSVTFLPTGQAPTDASSLAFAVWPYRNWEPDVLPYLPHPAYLQVRQGPEAQGDLDPAPYSIATLVIAEPRPDVPPAVAEFDNGIVLRAALVAPTPALHRPSDGLGGTESSSGSQVYLWWEPTEPLNRDYTVYVHYLRDGERIAQHDGQPGLGHLKTSFWQPGDLILDVHPVPDVTASPDHDRLLVGLYDAETGDGLPARVNGALTTTGVELPVILTEPLP